MNFETALLKTVFVTCTLTCLLMLGAMLTATPPHVAPTAIATAR